MSLIKEWDTQENYMKRLGDWGLTCPEYVKLWTGGMAEAPVGAIMYIEGELWFQYDYGQWKRAVPEA